MQGVEKVLDKNKQVHKAFMDLQKASDKDDKKGLQKALTLHGVSGTLLSAFESFYRGSGSCVRVSGNMSEWVWNECGSASGLSNVSMVL